MTSNAAREFPSAEAVPRTRIVSPACISVTWIGARALQIFFAGCKPQDPSVRLNIHRDRRTRRSAPASAHSADRLYRPDPFCYRLLRRFCRLRKPQPSSAKEVLFPAPTAASSTNITAIFFAISAPLTLPCPTACNCMIYKVLPKTKQRLQNRKRTTPHIETPWRHPPSQ